MIVNGTVRYLRPIILIANMIALPAMAQSTSPTAPERAILVLDASGSMWGQIEGTPKIAIAQEVIKGILQDWSPKVELGLTAYGHREKGNCADIETLAPVGPIDAQSIMTTIEGLNPKGKTPLTAAVQQAAEALKYTEEKATVILVSDGEETCDLDPCAIGEALESAGVDFTAHIISFDVPEEETAGLRCLANETGGVFLEASNADELNEAMSEATEIIADESPIELGEATLSVPEEVVAGSEFKVEWTGPGNYQDILKIFSTDAEKPPPHVPTANLSGGSASPRKLRAPEKPGIYEVRYVTGSGESLALDNFTVIAAEASVITPEEVVAGSKFKVEWTGPGNHQDILKIFSTDAEIPPPHVPTARLSEGSASPTKLRGPEKPGIYEVRYVTSSGNTLARDTFTVVPAEATVSVPEEVLAGSVFEVEWSGPLNFQDKLETFSEDGKNMSRRAYITDGEAASPAELTAPEKPGIYEVHYLTHGGNTLARDTFTVR